MKNAAPRPGHGVLRGGHAISLERRKGGAKLVSDIDLIPRKSGRRLLSRFLRGRKPAPKKAA